MSPIKDCTAVILAGGESKRMGEDKANLVWNGKTLLDHVSEQLAPLFSELVVSVRNPRPELHWKQVCDIYLARAPITGLISALKQSATSWVFLIGCDMPWVSAKLVCSLAEKRSSPYDAVVPVILKQQQPLFAFYCTSSLPVLESQLKKEERSLIRALQHLNPCWVKEKELRLFDPKLKSFSDIDTPEEWKNKESLFS